MSEMSGMEKAQRPWSTQVLTLLQLTTMVTISSAQPDGRAREYCEVQKFAPSCGQSEVVMVTSAIYGRMRRGRCVKVDDATRCSLDVLGWLDAWCSGLPECSVDVSNLNKKERPCPADYRSYLEAAYTCEPVLSGDATCDIIQVDGGGAISQAVTSQSPCGTTVRLQAATGQKIQITLLDFSRNSHDQTTGCTVYATLVENGRDTATVCGQHVRERIVHTTRSNTLDVRLTRPPDDKNFLLRYKAVGCPDPARAPGRDFRRTDDNAIEIWCDSPGRRQNLVCEGSRWNALFINCSALFEPSSSSTSFVDDQAIHNGIAVAIMVGIAVCVGLTILLVGVVCIRRRSSPPSHHHTSSPHHTQPLKQLPSPPTHPAPHSQDYPQRGNDYYRTWQMQQHSTKCTRDQAELRAHPEPRSLFEPRARVESRARPEARAKAIEARDKQQAEKEKIGAGVAQTKGLIKSPVNNPSCQETQLQPIEHEYQSPTFDGPSEKLALEKGTFGDNISNYFEIDPNVPQQRPKESQRTSVPAESPDKNFLYGRYST